MRNRIIYLLLLLCMIAGGRAEALSLEAQNAIETIRARLNAAAVPVEPVAKTVYIPGRDLADALTRLRQKLHGIEVVAEPSPESPVESKNPATDDCSSYMVGERLAAALLKVRQSQGRTESLQIAMAGIDKSVSAEPAVESAPAPAVVIAEPEVSVSEPAPVVDEKPATDPQAPGMEITTTPDAAEKVAVSGEKKENDKKVAGKNGKKSKKKRAKKQTRQIVEKKTAPVSEKMLKADKADQKNPEEDDQKFNEFIKKYDFKMPENYRIIVR